MATMSLAEFAKTNDYHTVRGGLIAAHDLGRKVGVYASAGHSGIPAQEIRADVIEEIVRALEIDQSLVYVEM